jgi:hypothetical protein
MDDVRLSNTAASLWMSLLVSIGKGGLLEGLEVTSSRIA